MFRHIASWLAVAFLGWFALTDTSAARGQDRYYMLIFAAEGEVAPARSAHTFATFIKVEEMEDMDIADWPMEMHTISWLPANLDVRLLASPEQGANLDLKATLDLEKSRNARVSAWGPFEIRKDLYDRAQAQIKRLNSGQVAYKAIDRRFRPRGATNCFHAISDIVDGPLLDTGSAFGEAASRMVLQHISPSIIDPTEIHRNLVPRLGLTDYGITFHDEVPVTPKK
jgi:hypothetical protein